MKRFFLLCCALVASISAISAQGLGQSWWGVRGGVNFSNISSIDYSTDYYTGFAVGAIYAHPLSATIPIFIEGGLYFQHRGARDNGFLTESGEDSLLRIYEFEVPLLLGFHTPIASDWSLQPVLGLYYSVAVNGKFKISDGEFDPYKGEMLQTLRDSEPFEQQLLHRSDFGMRFGASFLYKKYVFSLFYDAGMTNLYTKRLRNQGYEAQSGCFTLQLGCNF